MQVENNIQNKASSVDSEDSPQKELPCPESKQSRAENRIARYEQKPERKASKMLVRLLQWADKLVIKFFTKKMLPNELQIFFNREARANKVELKKAQIDYSVEDFAVRLYVFWVCQNYFQKVIYEENLEKLLFELRDELSRKRKNLAESLQMCQEQSEKKQKEEELKWMSAIITGLSNFIDKYVHLLSEEEALEFLLQITSNIMIDCLRKPGNKLSKKKQKLKTKIQYFQEKIAEILGNPEHQPHNTDSQKKTTKIVQKNTIIISPSLFPLQGLVRKPSNSSAFQKYKGDEKIEGGKREDFEVKLEYPKKIESNKKQQSLLKIQGTKSCEKVNPFEKFSNSLPTSEVKMDEECFSSLIPEPNSEPERL